MEEIAKRINDLRNYLNLNLVHQDNKYILLGIVFIKARFMDYSIAKQYSIKIEIARFKLSLFNSYENYIPKIYVYRGIEPGYCHMYSDNSLCLDSSFIQYNFLLKNNFDYVEWFKYFFNAFVVEYEYYRDYGCSLGMSRSHGKEGILEALIDYLGVPLKKRELLKGKIRQCVTKEQIMSCIVQVVQINSNKWEISEIVREYFELK